MKKKKNSKLKCTIKGVPLKRNDVMINNSSVIFITSRKGYFNQYVGYTGKSRILKFLSPEDTGEVN